MLRQLARLTRPVPAAGPRALAVAVYTDATDATVAARDRGFEGVACVDDAARLLGLLCRVWQRAPLDPIRDWALGVQEFLLWMEEPGGGWLNFIEDWDGTRNATGPTSSRGENFWQARAVCALAESWFAFGDARTVEALREGLDRARSMQVPSDVRSLHLRLALRLDRAGWPEARADLRRWADEVASSRAGALLTNNPDETGEPHLWAHVQEGVLAMVGHRLEDRALIDVALASGRGLLAPVVERGFARPATTPYDVASTIYGLDRLARVEPDGPWTSLAHEARGWFDGRNPAGVPVYDRARGRVADGIDGTRVNANSGAEANVEAGGALFEDAVASAARIGPGPTVN